MQVTPGTIRPEEEGDMAETETHAERERERERYSKVKSSMSRGRCCASVGGGQILRERERVHGYVVHDSAAAVAAAAAAAAAQIPPMPRLGRLKHRQPWYLKHKEIPLSKPSK